MIFLLHQDCVWEWDINIGHTRRTIRSTTLRLDLLSSPTIPHNNSPTGRHQKSQLTFQYALGAHVEVLPCVSTDLRTVTGGHSLVAQVDIGKKSAHLSMCSRRALGSSTLCLDLLFSLSTADTFVNVL